MSQSKKRKRTDEEIHNLAIENNKRYNAERKAQAELMKRNIVRDELLEEMYKTSYNRIQAQIDNFYMKYATQEGLTKEEARKLVDKMDVRKFNDAARLAVEREDESEETSKWLKVYNLRMKTSRLEMLKAQLQQEMQDLTAKQSDLFDKARREELYNAYARQAGILGEAVGELPKQIQAVLKADFFGQNFSSRVWGTNGLQANLQKDVFVSLSQIFTDMNGYKKQRTMLARKYNTSKSNAQRLLKTEIARINSDTQLEMLKKEEFTHLVYVFEGGDCKICSPLDNKLIPIEKAEKGVNMYPMHPNCNCSAYGQILMRRKDGTTNLDGFKFANPEDDNRYKKTTPKLTYTPPIENDTIKEKKVLKPISKQKYQEVKEKATEAPKKQLKPLTQSKYIAAKENNIANNIYNNRKDISNYKVFGFDNLWEMEPFFNGHENYAKWANKLTDKDKKIINSYTDFDGIFNTFLREGNLGEVADILQDVGITEKDVAKSVKVLNNALSGYKVLDDVVVHRGLASLPKDLQRIEVGKAYTLDKGFMSTSIDEGFPRQFLQDDIKYLYKFKLNKGDEVGAYINDLSQYKDEYEFLIKPETKFVASRIYDENNGGYDVTVIEWEVFNGKKVKTKAKGNSNK